MNFEYRRFKLECNAIPGGLGFIATVNVYALSTLNVATHAHASGALKSFATELGAIDFARNYGAMWCDTVGFVQKALPVKRRGHTAKK
jgi:hypothetical protein